MSPASTSTEIRCVNTLRGLAMDAVQAAGCGHPGLPMGAAPMAYALWTRHLRHNPRNPHWFNRDRFVLSAGHGSMLLYGLLHLTGYDVSLDDLRNFRQWGSITPGHPENTLTPGVEMATGPLGQGFSTSVGMALAERFLAALFNRDGHRVVDHFTYVLCSDGDLMEGVSSEAASLAGHQKLGKLIALYDDNGITIDGSTSLAFTEDVAQRFEAYGWHTQHVDGLEVDEVDAAIRKARDVEDQPSLILARTVIGYGSPNRAGTAKAHGEALGEEEVRLAKEVLGIPQEPTFFVPDEVRDVFGAAVERGAAWEAAWGDTFDAFALAHPDLAEQLRAAMSREAPAGWAKALPEFTEKMATRASSGQVLNAIEPSFPTLVGGSADLTGSVDTRLKDSVVQQPEHPGGRNFAYGVREHAMAAAINGMTLHGGVRAYGGTFLMFSDYCKPALRLAALMECPSIFVFTHDSVLLGEDGPTHQPIEHLAGLRAIPNFNVMRPADGNETAACWKIALESTHTPSAIVLTRQGVPQVAPPVRGGDHPALRGGYVLREASSLPPALVLVATGSEVSLALEAADLLEESGTATRVVSLPSWHVFELQDAAARERVLPRGVPTVSIEAAATLGWARYADAHVGLDRFGASAPAKVIAEKLGLTAAHVAEVARRLLGQA